MVPENLRYGGGVSGSVLHPAVALVMVITGLLILVLPQRKVIVPFLLSAILIPQDQVLVIAGLHFPVLRVLIIFGILRIVMLKAQGKTIFSGGINKIDIAFILMTLASAISGILLFKTGQAVIFQFGELYSAFGAYFLLRCIVRDQDDVIRALQTLAVVVAVLAVVMTCEQVTGGWNPYFVLGGARGKWSMERDGAVRAMGSFGQPLLAGTLGATCVPLFIGLWLRDKTHRTAALIGIVSGIVMAVASHSSTCLSGLIAGFLAIALWQARKMMRLIRWAIVITLVSLHMVMKAPVWNLIARIDLSGGSTSWHRYYLIDTCIRHFWGWWLIGTNDNANWGWDMWDTADQYVQNAYHGGLLGLIFLIAILVYAYKYVGWARKAVDDRKEQLFLWCLGACVFSYTMCFIGVSLWDQSIVQWYLLLATIGATAVPILQTGQVPKETANVEVLAPAEPELEPASFQWSSRRLREIKHMSVSLDRERGKGF